MMLLRNLRGSTPLGLWLSPHRADTKRLDRQPSHLRATCDVPVAEPTTAHLFTGRVSATPIASTYCMHTCSRQGCTHAVSSQSARASSLQFLESVDIAKVISSPLQPPTSLASLRRHSSRKRCFAICYGYLSNTSPPNHQLPYPGTSACHRQPRRGPQGGILN
jgi:hypothetical protein